jgi:hypothetical protein
MQTNHLTKKRTTDQGTLGLLFSTLHEQHDAALDKAQLVTQAGKHFQGGSPD